MRWTKGKIWLIADNKKALVADHVFFAKGFFTRLLGLMGQKHLPPKHCLVFYPCNGVHSFFMRFPIDVVYLDRNLKVVRVKQNFSPWRVDWPCLKARYVLELPAGTFKHRKGTIVIECS